ncbi:transmembrane protein 138-domain-containing protein [Pavlovales sp. CCMP2436]|nr:transmembrane protein 138-domain-containing protein [Pavlovales sp. CCMP2436]
MSSEGNPFMSDFTADPTVSRASYVGKVATLYAMLLADAILNAVTDTSVNTLELVVFVTFLQVLLRFLSLMLLFLLATATLLFRSGMLDVLLRQFANVLGVSALSLLLCLGTRAFRIILLSNNTPPEAYFQYDGYFALYVVHNLISVLFYHMAISATFRLSDPVFYDARVWRRV